MVYMWGFVIRTGVGIFPCTFPGTFPGAFPGTFAVPGNRTGAGTFPRAGTVTFPVVKKFNSLFKMGTRFSECD